MAHLDLRGVSVFFPVLHGSARSLKKTLFSRAKTSLQAVQRCKKGLVGGEMVLNAASGAMEVQALCALNLKISGGERVGLVGHNGAGKSTLLRLLAGIYEASHGAVDIVGETHALIDLNSGMNGELTGRENLHLFAVRMGWSRQRRAEIERDVQEFAELGPFFDLPVRLYSSGMGVRLGFALATVPQSEILLMDEWFMAGDHAFQEKARQRLERMVSRAEILVVTSHSMPVLRQWCTRVIWLETGKIRMDGAAQEVLDAYEASFAS